MQRDCEGGLGSALVLLVMIGVNPHIRNVVIEYFSDFVDDSGAELRGHFGTGDPSADPLDFTLVNQADSFDLLGVLLPQSDLATTERGEPPLPDLECHAASAHLAHDIGEGPVEAVDTLI